MAPRRMTTSEAKKRWERLIELMLATSEATYGVGDGGGNRRSFGSNALKVDGRIFALFSHDRLVVKLPAKRVEILIAEGAGRRFDPGHGRLMREWLDVGIDDPATWHNLASEALAFVSGRGR